MSPHPLWACLSGRRSSIGDALHYSLDGAAGIDEHSAGGADGVVQRPIRIVAPSLNLAVAIRRRRRAQGDDLHHRVGGTDAKSSPGIVMKALLRAYSELDESLAARQREICTEISVKNGTVTKSFAHTVCDTQ